MTAKEKLASVKIYGRNVSEFLLPDQMAFIERAMDEYADTKQKLNIASVVRPEVESAKEGELLPASGGEANTCADWKVKCHKCGNGFEKVTDLY